MLKKLINYIGKLGIKKLQKVLSILNSLKSKVEKLNIEKLISVPTDLSKLNDVVNNEVVKKMCLMNWLGKLMLLLLVYLRK